MSMPVMGSGTRWGRLAADLAAEFGTSVRMVEKPYSEAVYGRVRHGVSRSAILGHPGGGAVEIHDGWWRKNPDVWIGWQVWVDGPDGIVRREWPATKKRSAVISAVREALVLSVPTDGTARRGAGASHLGQNIV